MEVEPSPHETSRVRDSPPKSGWVALKYSCAVSDEPENTTLPDTYRGATLPYRSRATSHVGDVEDEYVDEDISKVADADPEVDDV